jgi:nucleolin
MVYPTLNKAVANIVMEEKKKAIGELIEHLSKKIEIDDDMKEIFDEFLDNMKETDEQNLKVASKGSRTSKKSDDPDKKKRPPTPYNLYQKEMTPIIREEHPEITDGRVRMSLIAASWKKDPMALFIKDKVAEMKKENKDGDVVEFYAKAKAMYAEQETESSSVKKSKPKPKSDSDKESDKDQKKPAKKLTKKPSQKVSEEASEDSDGKSNSDSDKESDKDKKTPAKKPIKKSSIEIEEVVSDDN